jgi:hypothetical protein
MAAYGKLPILSSPHTQYPGKVNPRLLSSPQIPSDSQSNEISSPSQSTQRPPGLIPVSSLLNPKDLGVFITAGFLKVPLFIRIMVTNLKPFFTAIMPLIYAALFTLSITFVIETYTMIINLLGEHSKYIIAMLFYFLSILARLFFTIRKAQKLSVLYDKLFFLAANYYKSAIIYMIIFLISLTLVYLCVCDCNSICD